MKHRFKTYLEDLSDGSQQIYWQPGTPQLEETLNLRHITFKLENSGDALKFHVAMTSATEIDEDIDLGAKDYYYDLCQALFAKDVEYRDMFIIENAKWDMNVVFGLSSNDAELELDEVNKVFSDVIAAAKEALNIGPKSCAELVTMLESKGYQAPTSQARQSQLSGSTVMMFAPNTKPSEDSKAEESRHACVRS